LRSPIGHSTGWGRREIVAQSRNTLAILGDGEHRLWAIIPDTRLGIEVHDILVRETHQDTKHRACGPWHQSGALGDGQIKALDPGSADVGGSEAVLLEQRHIHEQAVEKDLDGLAAMAMVFLPPSQ
jgi:hypothetical protein